MAMVVMSHVGSGLLPKAQERSAQSQAAFLGQRCDAHSLVALTRHEFLLIFLIIIIYNVF